jgi:hypothetical protein
MGFLSHFLYPWGLLLQGLAVVHFIRRRPDTYWIYIILFLGPIGATIYLFRRGASGHWTPAPGLQRVFAPEAHSRARSCYS